MRRAEIIFRRRQYLLDAAARLYGDADPATIEAHQVESFNRIWQRCLEVVPFYQTWARTHGLPRRIAGTRDLLDFPIISRATIVERRDEIFQGGRIKRCIITGGSLGEPARFPDGPADADGNWVGAYIARGWWGIRPFDRQVLIWGHGHLFGDGPRRYAAIAKRALADWVINARRLNGYDMSDGALARYAAVLRREKPVFVVGYTSTLFRLARHVEQSGVPLVLPGLKGVIMTSESASISDLDLILRTFGAPAIIEYGAAETGVIACSRKAADPMRLQLLWDRHIAVNDHGRILLTTIADRLFPLINYDVGDRTEPLADGRGTVTEFSAILGRAQDVVTLKASFGPDLVLSAIMLVHVLKADSAVRSVSFEQGVGSLTIFVEGVAGFDLARLAAYFSRQMKKDHPTYDPKSVTFARTSEPMKTPAGKHLLMRPPANEREQTSIPRPR